MIAYYRDIFAFVKTLGRLELFQWESKTRAVRSYCSECSTCNQRKNSGGQRLNNLTELQLTQ